MRINIFWFRRDLRLVDNAALSAALEANLSVIPIFIFDESILSSLAQDDPRVQFIHSSLEKIEQQLQERGKSILIKVGEPFKIWKELMLQYKIDAVYTNRDYEPYALKRDQEVKKLLESNGIKFLTFKDQVVFESHEVLKDDGKPYTVYTPYKKKWLKRFERVNLPHYHCQLDRLLDEKFDFPSLNQIGFSSSPIYVKPVNLKLIHRYESTRDFPAEDSTSYLSPHLRFGTVSVRQRVKHAQDTNETFLSELIWREFFMQILHHFPYVVHENFKSKYDHIEWRNEEEEFNKWCKGETGYPIVDAGMRELNQTGYMHNRVRMITASFLVKHLLVDWRWGEAYFAEKLLDFELASNNGNWQWVAGTGCDSAPYFRVFNPTEQVKKFDNQMKYIKKWVSDLNDFSYPKPMVEHKFARERVLSVFKEGLSKAHG